MFFTNNKPKKILSDKQIMMCFQTLPQVQNYAKNVIDRTFHDLLGPSPNCSPADFTFKSRNNQLFYGQV